MVKPNVTGTIEWANWDRLEPVSPTPLAKASFVPFLASNDETPASHGAGHDHGANGLDFGPPPGSALGLIISGQVSTHLVYFHDDEAASANPRIPVHTPDWTNPRPGDPGRTLTETDSGDTAAQKAQLTLSGQLNTPPIYFDDEDFDLPEMSEVSKQSPQQADQDAGTGLETLTVAGILIDFEDNASTIEEVLDFLAATDPHPEDTDTRPDSIQAPGEPEPPTPHAMAQFILIVGMADTPTDDNVGLDDGGMAAAVA